MQALVLLQLENKRASEVLEEICDEKRISEVYSIVGAWDAVLLVTATDFDELESTIRDTVGVKPGVVRTETHIINRIVSSKMWSEFGMD